MGRDRDIEISFARRCAAHDCYTVTRENKPYCTEHVLMHPYAWHVRCLFDSRKLLEKRAIEGERVDTKDALAKDILLLVRLKGPLTMQRISREMSCEHRVVRHYIEALEEALLLVESPGNRATFYKVAE